MRKIKSLDDTLFFIQFKKHVEKLEKRLHKEVKTLIIKSIIIFIPAIVLVINAFTFNNSTILIASLLSIASLGIGSEIVDMIKSHKRKKEDDDLVLNIKTGHDYYTPSFKETLGIEKTQSKEANLEIVDNEKLEKEAAISKVVEEIEAYTTIYNLPQLKLSDANWDKLFDILYGIYVSKGMEESYYDYLSFLVRYVFSKVLLDGATEIRIDTFIENIDILKGSLTEEEIKYIKDEFVTDLKVVDITKLQRKNKKNKNRLN